MSQVLGLVVRKYVVGDGLPLKKPQACSHCHRRKVRCDAWSVGIPCSRCKYRQQADTCVLVAPPTKSPKRSSRKRQKTSAQPVEVSQAVSSNEANHDASSLPSSLSPDQAGVGSTREAASDFLPQLSQSETYQLSPILYPRNQVLENTGQSMGEEDVQYRICQEMSQARQITMSPSPGPTNTSRREVIEFHEGVNSMTILGEVIGKDRTSRLVKVVVIDEAAKPNQTRPDIHVDEADMEYLVRKGALTSPSRPACDELLRLYFKCIYPYAPILDRIKFIEAYRTDQHSPFLLQAILANVVPYASTELLLRAGYEDRLAAQKSMFSKAKLLYDLHEKNQLALLQGSIILSSLSFSYAIDKDYRYWLSNAVRIATRMGLHRNHVYDRLGKRTRRLFRRIWWVLFNRDVLLAISGLDNLRRFDDQYCDTSPLTEADWADEIEIPINCMDMIQPISTLQMSFMVEYSKLSVISGDFIRNFKTPSKQPGQDDIESLSERISSWRQDLPVEMQIHCLQEWCEDNIWSLVLLAMGYRLEAVFCRAVKAQYRKQNNTGLLKKMALRQESAMFELSTIIQRAFLHDVLHMCPLSFMTCASTNLAMRIEIALDPSISPRRQIANKTQIFAELEYLRDSCESWSSLVWTLRMFEAVIARTQLSIASSSQSGIPEGAIQNALGQPHIPSQVRISQEEDESISGRDMDLTLALSDDCFGILPFSDNSDWLQSLFDMNGCSSHSEQ